MTNSDSCEWRGRLRRHNGVPCPEFLRHRRREVMLCITVLMMGTFCLSYSHPITASLMGLGVNMGWLWMEDLLDIV